MLRERIGALWPWSPSKGQAPVVEETQEDEQAEATKYYFMLDAALDADGTFSAEHIAALAQLAQPALDKQPALARFLHARTAMHFLRVDATAELTKLTRKTFEYLDDLVEEELIEGFASEGLISQEVADELTGELESLLLQVWLWMRRRRSKGFPSFREIVLFRVTSEICSVLRRSARLLSYNSSRRVQRISRSSLRRWSGSSRPMKSLVLGRTRRRNCERCYFVG